MKERTVRMTPRSRKNQACLGSAGSVESSELTCAPHTMEGVRRREKVWEGVWAVESGSELTCVPHSTQDHRRISNAPRVPVLLEY